MDGVEIVKGMVVERVEIVRGKGENEPTIKAIKLVIKGESEPMIFVPEVKMSMEGVRVILK